MDLAHLVRAGLVKMRGRIARGLRAPALHFAVIGAALFAGFGLRGDASSTTQAPREAIVIGASQVDQLVARFQRSTGLPVTPRDAETLVEREIEEEILFREARRRGFDRGDSGVEWRLIEKMTFLSDHEDPSQPDLLDRARGLGLAEDDPIVRRILVEKMRLALAHAGSETAPTEAELRAFLEQHADRFTQPARLRLSQVVLSRASRPAHLERDARALREWLQREAIAPEQATLRGDPFPLPLADWSIAEGELAARFGTAFAAAVEQLEPGRWSEPLPSPFGLHLVWVHERVSARVATLEEARGRVLYGLLAERRAQALEERLAGLRAAYDVRIEWPASIASAARGGRP